MRSSNPHVAIVVHQSDEATELFSSGWGSNLQDRINLFRDWLDSFSSDPVSKTFKFSFGKEGLIDVAFETCVFDSF